MSVLALALSPSLEDAPSPLSPGCPGPHLPWGRLTYFVPCLSFLFKRGTSCQQSFCLFRSKFYPAQNNKSQWFCLLKESAWVL